ncbi:hypothetical protein GCM10010104_11320 [Streptomyces indiaensis]|uniref:Uncharacterized protein n=1 Tax=Streptomyces indiaensis TaxID=284033 RepID=A0ABP5Q112_9ACTN
MAAVVGAVGVPAVPAALEALGADHLAARRTDRVLVLELDPVLEAGAGPGRVGVAPPFALAFASPVMMRRKRGMATTLVAGLPTKVRLADVGVRILPTLPSAPPPGLPASALSTPARSRSTGQ